MASSKTADTDIGAGVLNNEEWNRRWGAGQTSFHVPTHSPMLDKFAEKFFGAKKKSVFVPLCGKTPDMKWMYDNGHTVCGVEISEQAVKEFFEENGIETVVSEKEHVGKVHQSKDGRVQLYVADLFDMSVDVCGQQFDVIYDSRSIPAINVADRMQYAKLLLSLMRKDGCYVLSTRDFDPSCWPAYNGLTSVFASGPPHPMTEKEVRALFSTCDVEMINEKDQTGTNIHPHYVDQSGGMSEIAAALIKSPFVYSRWFFMTLK